MSRTIDWPAQEIWQAVVTQLPEFSVEIVPQIDSTNSELMRRARAGRLEPVLLVAEQQNAGRGRLGRHWFSTAMASVGATPGCLTFSIGLAMEPRDWSGLSLAVGLSVVESLHPDLGLKWPNDVWWQGRKLAGILIETVSVPGARYAVIGVGINIDQPTAGDFSTQPAWLAELMPETNAAQALLRIAPALMRRLKAFEASGFAPLQQRFRQRDVLAQQLVTLSDGTSGLALGVDEVGALLVQTEQGLKRIASAEVSLRPASSTVVENRQRVIKNSG